MLWFSLSSFIGLPLVYAGAVERQVSPIKMVKGSLPGKPFREPEPAQTGRCRVRMGCGVQTVTYVSGLDKADDGGESGIRTHDRLFTYTRVPGVRLQPLGHLSLSNGAQV